MADTDPTPMSTREIVGVLDARILEYFKVLQKTLEDTVVQHKPNVFGPKIDDNKDLANFPRSQVRSNKELIDILKGSVSFQKRKDERDHRTYLDQSDRLDDIWDSLEGNRSVAYRNEKIFDKMEKALAGIKIDSKNTSAERHKEVGFMERFLKARLGENKGLIRSALGAAWGSYRGHALQSAQKKVDNSTLEKLAMGIGGRTGINLGSKFGVNKDIYTPFLNEYKQKAHADRLQKIERGEANFSKQESAEHKRFTEEQRGPKSTLTPEIMKQLASSDLFERFTNPQAGDNQKKLFEELVKLAKTLREQAEAVTGKIEGDEPMMAKGGIVTKKTRATVGEAGPEAIIPLTEFTKTFDTIKHTNSEILKETDGAKDDREDSLFFVESMHDLFKKIITADGIVVKIPKGTGVAGGIGGLGGAGGLLGGMGGAAGSLLSSGGKGMLNAVGGKMGLGRTLLTGAGSTAATVGSVAAVGALSAYSVQQAMELRSDTKGQQESGNKADAMMMKAIQNIQKDPKLSDEEKQFKIASLQASDLKSRIDKSKELRQEYGSSWNPLKMAFKNEDMLSEEEEGKLQKQLDALEEKKKSLESKAKSKVAAPKQAQAAGASAATAVQSSGEKTPTSTTTVAPSLNAGVSVEPTVPAAEQGGDMVSELRAMKMELMRLLNFITGRVSTDNAINGAMAAAASASTSNLNMTDDWRAQTSVPEKYSRPAAS